MKKSVHSVGDLVGHPNPKGKIVFGVISAKEEFDKTLIYDIKWFCDCENQASDSTYYHLDYYHHSKITEMKRLVSKANEKKHGK